MKRLLGVRIEDTRKFNSRITFDTIRLHSPITRVEIVKITGLTASAISSLTADLLAQGLIVEKGRRKGNRGQPAIDLEINPNSRFSIGFELGRDHISGLLLNLAGHIIKEVHREWQYPPPEIALPFLAKQVKQLITQSAISPERLLGVGVAMPGPFLTSKKNIVYPIDFPHWERFPIVDKLQELLGYQVFLENNARASAIGEQFHGDGRLYEEFFYLDFGAWLGGAMISGGRPYQENSPHAAQLDRIPLVIRKRMVLGLRPLCDFLNIRSVQVSDTEELKELFQQQNPYLWEWLNEAVEQLHIIIESINSLLGPEVIFVGGRLPESIIDYLLERLDILGTASRATLPENAVMFQANLLQATSGKLACALGAATLPLYQLFSTQRILNRK
ncbi:MAG: ROK family transcriptional regulator [bacterium]|nr:ROK family transcriptional regulator [bacterium]